ncbi:MAG: hypothetical protein GXP26_05015 [Planctomycetes bacterium]|nr:hypothetical protein [Planctomycetota bacterium]
MTANALDELIDDGTTAEDIALARCQTTAKALELLDRENVDFLNSGQRRPPESLYDALESLLDCVAIEPGVGWPQKSWAFLAHATTLAESVGQYGLNWRDHVGTWGPAISKRIQLAFEEQDNLLDPTLPVERVVALETVEDLVEQKVSDYQIAKIYEWFDDQGYPDTAKAKACRKGEVKAPVSKTFPPSVSGPQRQPHLGAVDNCVHTFEEIRSATKVIAV